MVYVGGITLAHLQARGAAAGRPRVEPSGAVWHYALSAGELLSRNALYAAEVVPLVERGIIGGATGMWCPGMSEAVPLLRCEELVDYVRGSSLLAGELSLTR